MYPVLWSYDSFRLPTYGALLAAGMILGIWTAGRLGRRAGMDSARLLDLSTWMVIAGLIGAKVLMMVAHADFYVTHPAEIFSWATLRAGGAFYGGLLAALIFAMVYIRAVGMPLWKTLDVYAPALALGHAVGRLGCFAAGCDYGKPTDLGWGVVFSDPVSHDLVGIPLGIRLHPTQLYEAAANFLIFLGLLLAQRRKAHDGMIFLCYLLAYGAVRFTVEYFRGDPGREFIFGGPFSFPQMLSLAASATAIALMIYFRRRGGEGLSRPLAG